MLTLYRGESIKKRLPVMQTSEHFSAKSKATSGTFTISLNVSEITTFLKKMAKFTNLKFLKYGALTNDYPCDPKFASVLLYLSLFLR